ncbi:hypothetical protein MRY82_06215 [bacterium]|nr:hypothetical protein [bacterium]
MTEKKENTSIAKEDLSSELLGYINKISHMVNLTESAYQQASGAVLSFSAEALKKM